MEVNAVETLLLLFPYMVVEIGSLGGRVVFEPGADGHALRTAVAALHPGYAAAEDEEVLILAVPCQASVYVLNLLRTGTLPEIAFEHLALASVSCYVIEGLAFLVECV